MDSDSSPGATERDRDEAGETTVLLVDDEQHLREAYADLLKEKFTVRTAADGEAALAAMTDNVDVVLLDRRMPGLDGADVLDDIRKNDYDGPVVIVSAVDPLLQKIEQHVEEYLFKPVNRDELIEAIEQVTPSQ
jgi:DNA-binding NtrC family response regulator